MLEQRSEHAQNVLRDARVQSVFYGFCKDAHVLMPDISGYIGERVKILTCVCLCVCVCVCVCNGSGMFVGPD